MIPTLDTEPNGSDWRASEAFSSARRNMKGIDRDGLLAVLGGLALDPANAVQQLRLEALAHVAATVPMSVGGSKATAAQARRFASRAGAGLLPAAPDPPEQPFALPFVYGSTASVVPLGLVLGVDHDAHRMLEVLSELAVDSREIARVRLNVEGVLRLVGRATRDAGLTGVVEPGSERDRAHIPSATRLEAQVRAVRLSAGELRTELGDHWAAELAQLITDEAIATVTWDGQNGSVSHRPFVRSRDGGLIIAVPGMVLPAILSYATSELARLGPEGIADRYAECLWRDIRRSLGLMRIDRASEGPDPKGLVGRALFRVDEDQLLAVLLVAIDPFAPERTGVDPYEALEATHRDLLGRGPGHVVLVLFQASSDDAGSFFGLEAPPSGIVDVLMTPAELSVVARVEAGEPRTLSEYALASSQVRESVRVFGFGFLDEFTIYRQHQSSYYLDDSRRPTMITVAPGSGLELRLKAARRGVQGIVPAPMGGEVVRVMPRWDAGRGVWAPISGLGQPVRVVLTQPAVWVVGPPYQGTEIGDVEGWGSFVDSVAYWLWEMRADIEAMLGGQPQRAAVVAVQGVDEWRAGRHHLARGPILFRADREAYVLRIRTDATFAELAQAPDNEADRRLVASLIEGICQLTGATPLHPIAEIVNRVAPLGLKKMLLMVDLVANADIGPDDVPRWRRVRDAPVSAVLDELGAALSSDGWAAGPADSKPNRLSILHRAVAILSAILEREISEFGPDLLEVLLLRNEATLRERAQQGFHLPPRLRCFPEDSETLRHGIHDLDRASVAGRFLVEFVAARPGTGTKLPSIASLDRLAALSDALVQRGQAADLEYLDLVDTNARMLASGRLGINDQAMRTAMNAFAPSLVAQRHADAEASFQMRWREPRPGGGPLRVDEAARHEWGFSFTEMAQVLGATAGLSLDSGRPVMALRIDDAIQAISTESSLDAGLVARVIDELTLGERPRFDEPEPPFDRADVYPWRFNRRLSLLRKPFVRRPTAIGPEIVFGRRALIECLDYTMELLTTSRLQCRSAEMERLKGLLSVERGAAFNERVAVELEERLGHQVRRGVNKVAGLRLAVEDDDIGDVDVLGADIGARIIWAIECKALAPARTPHEIFWELAKLVGTKQKPGLLAKHARRLDWLIAHLGSVVTELALEGSDWTIKGAFVVDEDLLGPYIRETPVPVVTLTGLMAELELLHGGQARPD